MADIKFSEFPKATTSKDSDEIAILQDGVNKMIPSPVLESKIINKTVSRVIEQGGASLNVINLKGVVPTYADLALITPTPELNDAYQVEADGLVYVYTDNGFQADGEGFKVQSEPNGIVEEGNLNAVNGDKVWKATEFTEIVLDITDYSSKGVGISLSNGNADPLPFFDSTPFIELTADWSEINFYQPPTSLYGLAFYDIEKNFINFTYDDFQEQILNIKRVAELEDAYFIRHTKYATEEPYASDNELQLVLNLRNKELVKEYVEDNNLNKDGLFYENLGIDKFTYVGGFLPNGVRDDFNLIRSTDILKLPDDWESIEYLNPLSGGYRLVLLDELKRVLTSIPNIDTENYKKIKINRSDYFLAKYYVFNWSDSWIPLDFKIYRNTLNFKDSVISINEMSRLSNLTLTDLEDWNESNPSNQINEEIVFDGTEVVGKPISRIPSCIITNAGTYLVATEVRDNNNTDVGYFDLLVKRKVGEDWVETVIFQSSPEMARGMNPSFLVDRIGHTQLGRIYLFYAKVKQVDILDPYQTTADLDCVFRYSDNDGETWSEETSLKSLWDTTEYVAAFPSPSNGIQLTDGTFVVPCMNIKNESYRSSVLYKRPTGGWIFSEQSPRDLDNESLVIEYEKNRVLLNCRYDNSRFTRSVYELDFTTNKLIESEFDFKFDSQIHCQMSIDRIIIDGQTVYLMSFPDKSGIYTPNPQDSRYNITIWGSTDLKRWVRIYVVNHPVGLGYSVVNNYDNKIIVCYEKGINTQIGFQDISILKNKIKYDVFLSAKLSTEEKMNRIIYQLKGWQY